MWALPSARDRKLKAPLTLTGRDASDPVIGTSAFPSWPSAFDPQQYAAPSELKAQVWLSPAASIATAFGNPPTCVGVHQFRNPLPSAPEPQQ